MDDNFSPADLAAMMNNSNGGMGSTWNNPFFYLIFMWMFGNGGFGGWGNNSANANGTVTRAELADGLNNQTVLDDLRVIDSNVSNGVSNLNQSLCSGFNGVNSNINNGTNSIAQAINTSTFNNTQAIHDLQSANQMGFCNVNNNIGNLKYEMAQNCCDIKTAMHQEGELTRGLIQQNTIQDLRDKLADKASDLQAAQLTLANANQTQTLLNNLGKYVPANSSF